MGAGQGTRHFPRTASSSGHLHPGCPTRRGAARSACAVSSRSKRTPRPYSLVITELPYQVQPRQLHPPIAEQVRDGRLGGISNIEDQSSDRVGLRIVVELKARCRGQGRRQQPLQAHPVADQLGVNMLSIVDGAAPCGLDKMIHYRRASTRRHRAAYHAGCARPTAGPHPAGLVRGTRALDEGDRLIRASESADVTASG